MRTVLGLAAGRLPFDLLVRDADWVLDRLVRRARWRRVGLETTYSARPRGLAFWPCSIPESPRLGRRGSQAIPIADDAILRR
jgi:hypothetical protein